MFVSVLEVEITRLMDKQGANLFDIINPEVLPQDVRAALCPLFGLVAVVSAFTSFLSLPLPMLQGFVLTQMDFGFPHHLLVDFLKRTLQ